MPAELLSSKVVITEVPPAVRGIPAIPTAVQGMVVVAQRGPLNTPTLVTSWAEYRRIFGGFVLGQAGPTAVFSFFEEGGSRLYVTRVCHMTDVGDPATVTAVRASCMLTTPGADAPAVVAGNVGPFNLEPGQTVVCNVTGGGDDTATFDAAAGYVETAGNGPHALADDQTLTFAFQNGDVQTVTLDAADFGDIGAATNDELANAINRQILGGRAVIVANKLRVQSDRRGTSSSVGAPGGTAAATLAFGAAVAGTGDAANIDAVTFAEAKALIEADVAGVTVVENDDGEIEIRTSASGAAVSLRVKNTSTATGFGFDNDLHSGEDDASEDCLLVEGKTQGAYGNNLDAQVKAASSGEAARFNLVVIDDGKTAETWPNLSMDPDDARYVETIVNDAKRGSNLIRVTDQELDDAPRPDNQTGELVDGDDGLSGLVDADFMGGTGVGNNKTGLRSLDLVLDLSIAAIPGRASSALHNGLLNYCEVTRNGQVFAVLDPPADQTAAEMVTYVEDTASLLESSEYGAIYWPRVKILNPDRVVFGNDETITVFPSGVVCGIYCRNDAKRPGGIYDSPAGENGVCRSVLGFETDEVLDEAKRDLIYPKRINPITTEPGMPKYIDGGRTLKSTGNFPNVSERRGVIFIKRSVALGLKFAKHLNNDESLWARARRTVSAFLVQQMARGAFRSRDPEKAFFITCDENNNPASAVFAGELHLDMGLATQKPAEFVVISITQDTRALDAELAAGT
jgi:phage tail sheath protein FI